MKTILCVLALVACGGKQQPATTGPGSEAGPTAPAKDPRSAIEKRRDAACDQLQPKITQCAIDDAKASMSPADYAKLNPEELRAKHGEEFLKECKGATYSSRQVRVLEVCFQQEHECEPLGTCLENLNPKQGKQ